jgi:hypothetical protein
MIINEKNQLKSPVATLPNKEQFFYYLTQTQGGYGGAVLT